VKLHYGFQFFGAAIGFCLFIKRKDEDMLPYKVQPKDPEGAQIAEKQALALANAVKMEERKKQARARNGELDESVKL
jgi:hypothetical protein